MLLLHSTEESTIQRIEVDSVLSRLLGKMWRIRRIKWHVWGSQRSCLPGPLSRVSKPSREAYC